MALPHCAFRGSNQSRASSMEKQCFAVLLQEAVHSAALGNIARLAVLGCVWKNGPGNSSHPNDGLSGFDCDWWYVFTGACGNVSRQHIHDIQYEGSIPESNVQ